MKLREKIADFIGGGKIRELQEERDRLSAEVWSLNADLMVQASYRREDANEKSALYSALTSIAALETAKPNATVKKMARIARDALNSQ